MTPDRAVASPAVSPEAFRRLGYAAVDLVVDHLAGMRDRRVFTPMTPDERERLLADALPAAGADPDAILAAVAQRIMTRPMGNGHPRFFGWVNSPPAHLGILGDFLAAALDPSCAGGDHAAAYLERAAVRWLMELVGFPVDGSMGLLVSGGSMAALTCLAAARQQAIANAGGDVRAHGVVALEAPLVLYVSPDGHGCLRKTAELLGLGSANVRVVPARADFTMDVEALAAAVAADRAAGRRPFCVAASAGTTNTGAVDPFDEIADVCARERLWLHVDGAYGALGVLDPAVAWRFRGLDRADSLAMDPHKWLCVPVECGAALVRRGDLLRDAFSLVPPYLRTEEGRGFGGLPWFSEYGFQQSRGFRALKLWMTLSHLGRAGVVRLVTRANAVARHLAKIVDAARDFERVAPVTLSVVCFRYVGDRPSDDETLSAVNRRIVDAVQTGGEAFLTGTEIGGRAVLRACVLHYDSTESDVEALVTAIRTVASGRASGQHDMSRT